ncbi:relative of early flowering 6 [Actinidia rufa]|uniref:Relative of early flowering 6 n=1 Tax=Actinidia rufa TaxID=165716 RepID=A0A7J0DRL5_9ERIC|nr:relative of early flowering 6 [Actinidia rufa]
MNFGENCTDYPEVEAEAKLVAEELAINYFWNDIAFGKATKEDEERIQTALESEEEGTHGNGDWAVKLGIDLFYSADLGRSPLYKRDTEEGEEDNTRFHGWAKPEVKRERLSKRAHPAETNFEIKKIGKKRKNTTQKEGGAIKKSKSAKVEDSVKASDDLPEEGYQQYSRTFRNLRNKQLKLESPRPQRSSWCKMLENLFVTFPRAYHSGFSHGFNCGEAANIATPGWLRVAKDAAIRRAAINCPPMCLTSSCFMILHCHYVQDGKGVVKQLTGFYAVRGEFSSALMVTGLSVTCFACVAIVQPKDSAAHYLMSADCGIFNDGMLFPRVTSDGFTIAAGACNFVQTGFPVLVVSMKRDLFWHYKNLMQVDLSQCRWVGKSTPDGLFDVPIQSADHIQTVDRSPELLSDTEIQKALLPLAYWLWLTVVPTLRMKRSKQIFPFMTAKPYQEIVHQK